MDTYSGYNQILMHEDDKVKTSFIIKRGTYSYKVMPFGLKNAGATYQRLVNKFFKEQIGKTMEVYVDDMLVKTPECADHIKNLAEAFRLLCQRSIEPKRSWSRRRHHHPGWNPVGVSYHAWLPGLKQQGRIRDIAHWHADALASIGSALDTQFRRSIPVEHIDHPNIEEAEHPNLMQIDEDPSWQDPIIDYLVNENLPMGNSEARKIKQKAARYYMKGDMLVRKSYSGPHLTCIKHPQTLEVLCKIHDGECGNHAGGISL
ncbi:unnamed protein product, partial [Prunus brigantina]